MKKIYTVYGPAKNCAKVSYGIFVFFVEYTSEVLPNSDTTVSIFYRKKILMHDFSFSIISFCHGYMNFLMVSVARVLKIFKNRYCTLYFLNNST